MSYNKSDINLDNCDLYEYVMELDQQEKIPTNKMEHLYVPKIEKIRKDNSMNIILIIAIVLILLGLYCYFNKPNVLQNKYNSILPQSIQSDNMMASYYLA